MAIDARDFPLAFAWRLEMSLVLEQPLPDASLPSGMAFADLRQEQLPALARIEHLAFAGSVDARVFPELLQSPQACLRAWARTKRDFDPRTSLVLMRGAEPVGFVRAAGARGVATIDCVAVLPEFRGGVGRALMLEALRRMREHRYQVALLSVTAENTTALTLYERLGFREVGWSISIYRR